MTENAGTTVDREPALLDELERLTRLFGEMHRVCGRLTARLSEHLSEQVQGGGVRGGSGELSSDEADTLLQRLQAESSGMRAAEGGVARAAGERAPAADGGAASGATARAPRLDASPGTSTEMSRLQESAPVAGIAGDDPDAGGPGHEHGDGPATGDATGDEPGDGPAGAGAPEARALALAERIPRLTTVELAERLDLSVSTARSLLGRLVDDERLVRHGRGRGTFYTLPRAESLLGTTPEAEQARVERVLEMVRELDRVTTADVQREIGLSQLHSRQLLARMVDDGLLVRHGKRRGTYFVLAASGDDSPEPPAASAPAPDGASEAESPRGRSGRKRRGRRRGEALSIDELLAAQDE